VILGKRINLTVEGENKDFAFFDIVPTEMWALYSLPLTLGGVKQ
jgi:hypothetical protein